VSDLASGQPDSDYVYDDLQDAPGKPRRPRWCLGCCAALLALLALCCLGLAWLQSQFTDPQLAEARMYALVPSAVPKGYGGNLSVELGGLRVAVLAPSGSPPGQGAFTILAVAVPPQGNRDMALGQLRQGVVENFQIRVEDASQVVLTVRGQAVNAERLKGLTRDGVEVQIDLLAVARSGADTSLGDAILIAGGPLSSFDEEAWQSFLASIE
jgi:hypothetical protein